MRLTNQPSTSDSTTNVSVSVFARLLSFLLLAVLMPFGLLFAGLIWLEDGGPVFTGSLLDGAGDVSKIPTFRVATLHLEKWDICQLPASMGRPERLILVPTLTIIGRLLMLLNLDRLPAMLLVAMGRLSFSAVLRPRATVSLQHNW